MGREGKIIPSSQLQRVAVVSPEKYTPLSVASSASSADNYDAFDNIACSGFCCY